MLKERLSKKELTFLEIYKIYGKKEVIVTLQKHCAKNGRNSEAHIKSTQSIAKPYKLANRRVPITNGKLRSQKKKINSLTILYKKDDIIRN